MTTAVTQSCGSAICGYFENTIKPFTNDANLFRDVRVRHEGGKIRTAFLDRTNVVRKLVPVKERRIGVRDDPPVVLDVLPIRLVAVDFEFRHLFVRVAHADKRPAEASLAAIEHGTICWLHWRNLRADNHLAIVIDSGKEGADDRFHLAALLGHTMLQVLGIINSRYGKTRIFI